MTKLSVARVLCDVVAHGLKAGALVEADPALIKALAADGSVDTHKDAIAAGRDAGVEVQRSSIELAALALAAEADAMRVEVAKLKQLVAEAADDQTRDALERELRAKQSALDELAAPA